MSLCSQQLCNPRRDCSHQIRNIWSLDRSNHPEQLWIDLQWPFNLKGQADLDHGSKMPQFLSFVISFGFCKVIYITPLVHALRFMFCFILYSSVLFVICAFSYWLYMVKGLWIPILLLQSRPCRCFHVTFGYLSLYLGVSCFLLYFVSCASYFHRLLIPDLLPLCLNQTLLYFLLMVIVFNSSLLLMKR